MAGYDTKGIGDIILNRFRIVKVFPPKTALVYLVEDKRDPGKQFIAKRLRRSHMHDQFMTDLFTREIKISQIVSRHPNIVTLIDPYRFDVNDKVTYTFFEFVNGADLRDIVQRTHSSAIAYPQVLKWATVIASAMVYVTVPAKNGASCFVHRDLDASNILISNKCEAKVNDWGLAKDLLTADDEIQFATIGAVSEGAIGKSAYMPPELFPPDRGKSYSITGDIYYFGGILYEMLTGKCINPREETHKLLYMGQSATAVKDILAAHQQEVVIPDLEALGLPSRFIDFMIDCIQVDFEQRLPNFSVILSVLADLKEELLKTSTNSDVYLSCRNCGFIVNTRHLQSTCAICNTSDGFRRWQPLTEASATPDPPTPAVPVSMPLTVASDSIDSGQINELVAISGGPAIIGARPKTLARLTKKFTLSGEHRAQFQFPAETRVEIPAFEISRHAVSNDEYRDFVDAVKWVPPLHWQQNSDQSHLLSGGQLPVVNISFNDAEAFCQWKHARLPLNNEWERAARGKQGLAYPWGHRWQKSNGDFFCQTLERHEASGDELLAVDALPEGASADGVMNMAGNVWEWVDGGEAEMKHTRGGSWQYLGELFSAAWFRMPTRAALKKEDIGFRYVKDVSSGPLSMAPLLADLADIPAGNYALGISSKDLSELGRAHNLAASDIKRLRHKQSHTIRINAFQMRKFLVTNEEYYQFVSQNNYPWPEHWQRDLLSWSEFPFLSKYRYHPVTHIRYRDADAFCQWVGGRLPTNDEWEGAARSEGGNYYAWGNTFKAELANTGEFMLGRTSRVDKFPTGCSQTGVFDMTGNVMEWVAEENSQHFIRGGSYRNRGAISGLAFLKTQANPNSILPDVGFRCVF